jgi:hypothetical protein
MTLAQKVIELALSQVGVREQGRNRGKEVDDYIRSVGLDPTLGAYPWCASFVWWLYSNAAIATGMTNPLARHASVIRLWSDTPVAWRTSDPSKALPGSVFCIDHGQGKGHCGVMLAIGGPWMATVEGNTNDLGGREGDGVYLRMRSVSAVNLGWIVPG